MPLYQPPNPNEHVLSQFSLKGKIAAVTGGSRGIGAEVVRGLAEAGADVALIHHSGTTADELAAEISKATGQRVRAYRSNVASRDEIAKTLDEICEGFGNGRLDVVVANAGVCANIPSLEYTEETWRGNSGVNYDGVMWTAQAAGRIFKRQGKGNLIITASVSSILVNVPQTQAAYNSSKAAAVHLGKSLAVEWTEFARVNCVSPGFIRTEMLSLQKQEIQDQWMAMIPGRRLCEPAELKGTYVFLASDAASYMTGANIVIDGGYTLP